NFSLFRASSAGGSLGPLHPAACAAGELSRRFGCALNNRSDLFKGHGENIVQNKGEPFRGSQPVQYHEQREAYRIGQEDLLLRIGAVRLVREWIGGALLQGFFAS